MSESTHSPNTNTPDITIVVCTYNRSAMLRDALDSLSDLQTGDRFTYEILVVNNASTDDTQTVVERFAKDCSHPVRHVLEEKQGVVHARNRGVAESSGEWIAFFDDDQLADPRWLKTLLELAWEKQVRCVGGAVRLKLPDGVGRKLDPVCRMLLGESVGMDSVRRYSHRVTPGTGNLMVHRSVFDEIGTFDPAFHQRGEDTDLFLRMLDAGIVAWYSPAAIVLHVIPPERLEDDALKKLANLLVEGLAHDEQQAWGRWRYPFIWLARMTQAGLFLVPRLFWAWLRGDRERLLGATCRLSIAGRYLRDGFSLLFPWKKQHSKASAT
ncbi:MAG: hypothetical protein Tsb009_09590 [Planctomycetaceae bacterium]